MNRFFVDREQVKGDTIRILGKDVKHIKDVLRLKPKDRLEVVAEGSCHICEIVEIESNGVLVRILDTCGASSEPPIYVNLFQAIAKGDKMDLIIQKTTEIGVKEIIPVVTNRTVVKIKDYKKEKNKLDRWNSIAEEAAKQSKRTYIPTVRNIIDFKDMVELLKEEENIIVPYERERAVGLKEALKKLSGGRINIVIGPEGGFEEYEIEMLESIGAKSVTLGPRILRTETAGIITVALSLYELGDLGVILK
ncbi:MAG: 16S rRNA (uracil(1498)-N(3))-methyltransferase [Tissierellia bacterium]|nr:16S rRNA (uracil(1498)-N(3))-methyltransferase [Tissierellia bacterium]